MIYYIASYWKNQISGVYFSIYLFSTICGKKEPPGFFFINVLYIDMEEIICGDCTDILPLVPDASLSACITSPPYANQRSGDSSTGAVMYNGIPELMYPDWT